MFVTSRELYFEVQGRNCARQKNTRASKEKKVSLVSTTRKRLLLY